MRRVITLILAATLAWAVPAQAQVTRHRAGPANRAHVARTSTIWLGDRYYVTRHPAVTGQRAIVALHSKAHDWREQDGIWTPLAQKYGFLAVYPQAVGGSWNAGTCCPTASTSGRDDAGYVRAVVADVRRRFGVREVYLFGYSNGGMMAEQAVCLHPQIATRVAVQAASPQVSQVCSWTGQLFAMHGRLDTTVPWQGGWREGCACEIRPGPSTPQWFPQARWKGVLLDGVGHSLGTWPAGTHDRYARFLLTGAW